MAEPMTWENAIPALLERVPELRPVYQQLLDSEGPPIEQYTLMHAAIAFAEDLGRVAQGADTASPRAAETLRRLMDALEEMATSCDPYLPDLAGAGFVEGMDPLDPGFDYLVSLMRPATRRMVVESFAPDWQQGQQRRPQSHGN